VVRVRILALEAAADPGQLRTRLRDGRARPQARDDVEDPVFTVGFGADRRIRRAAAGQPQRHPQLGARGRKVESRRHHADDERRRAVEQQLAADRARIAAEAPLPQPVPEDRHSRPTRQIVVSDEGAARAGADAEHAEEIARAGRREHFLGLAAGAGDRHARAPVRRHA